MKPVPEPVRILFFKAIQHALFDAPIVVPGHTRLSTGTFVAPYASRRKKRLDPPRTKDLFGATAQHPARTHAAATARPEVTLQPATPPVVQNEPEPWQYPFSRYENGGIPSPEMWDGLPTPHYEGGTIVVEKNSDQTYNVSIKNSAGRLISQATRKDSVIARDAARRAYFQMNPFDSAADTSKIMQNHRRLVQQALAEGQPVPAAVLAEYPDLKPKTAQDQPPATPVQQIKNRMEELFAEPSDTKKTLISHRLQNDEKWVGRTVKFVRNEYPVRAVVLRVEDGRTYVRDGNVGTVVPLEKLTLSSKQNLIPLHGVGVEALREATDSFRPGSRYFFIAEELTAQLDGNNPKISTEAMMALQTMPAKTLWALLQTINQQVNDVSSSGNIRRAASRLIAEQLVHQGEATFPNKQQAQPAKASTGGTGGSGGSGSGSGNGGSGSGGGDGTGEGPPRSFQVTVTRKGKEVRFDIEDAFFTWLQIAPHAIWADIDRLQIKHPEYFSSPDAVQQHIHNVLTGAEIAMPATHPAYTLLVTLRENADHQAATVEFVLRGGKYRVRNAQKMPQSQLDVKLNRAGNTVRVRRGSRDSTVPPRTAEPTAISARSPVPPSDGPPAKPNISIPPVTSADKAEPASSTSSTQPAPVPPAPPASSKPSAPSAPVYYAKTPKNEKVPLPDAELVDLSTDKDLSWLKNTPHQFIVHRALDGTGGQVKDKWSVTYADLGLALASAKPSRQSAILAAKNLLKNAGQYYLEELIDRIRTHSAETAQKAFPAYARILFFKAA